VRDWVLGLCNYRNRAVRCYGFNRLDFATVIFAELTLAVAIVFIVLLLVRVYG
jgi:hypothetical protein